MQIEQRSKEKTKPEKIIKQYKKELNLTIF